MVPNSQSNIDGWIDQNQQSSESISIDFGFLFIFLIFLISRWADTSGGETDSFGPSNSQNNKSNNKSSSNNNNSSNKNSSNKKDVMKKGGMGGAMKGGSRRWRTSNLLTRVLPDSRGWWEFCLLFPRQ